VGEKDLYKQAIRLSSAPVRLSTLSLEVINVELISRVPQVASTSGDWATALVVGGVMLVVFLGAFMAIRYWLEQRPTSAGEPKRELKLAA
jgi:hypothetical protein